MSQEYKRICETCGTENDAYSTECVYCGNVLRRTNLKPEPPGPDGKMPLRPEGGDTSPERILKDTGNSSSGSKKTLHLSPDPDAIPDTPQVPLHPLQPEGGDTSPERILIIPGNGGSGPKTTLRLPPDQNPTI